MSTIFKGLALFVLIAAVTWVAVLWHWDSSRRDVDGVDIALYLGLLPLAGFALVQLLKAGWRASQTDVPGAASSLVAAGGQASPAQETGARELERRLAVSCHTAYLHLSGNSTAAELQAALHEGKLRPKLDATLRQGDGRPVMCARVGGLDTVALKQEARALSPPVRTTEPSGDASGKHLALPEAAWRALALLGEPMSRAVPALYDTWPTMFEGSEKAPHDPGHRYAEGEATAPEVGSVPAPLTGKAEPGLHILLALPQNCEGPACAVAEAWLLAQCQHWGIDAQRLVIQVIAVKQAGELWREVDGVLLAQHRQQRADVLIVVAAHSDLDADTIARLESEGRLYSPEVRPRGLMPGEGAAVLVLAPPILSPAPAAPEPPLLHRTSVALRSKSIDSPGRPGHAELLGACEQALLVAGVEASHLSAVASDADQHSARAGELFATVLALAPQLDAGEDVTVAGAALGHTGAVGSLVAIALAQAAVAVSSKPALAISSADPVSRLTWVVRPREWSPAAAEAATTTRPHEP